MEKPNIGQPLYLRYRGGGVNTPENGVATVVSVQDTIIELDKKGEIITLPLTSFNDDVFMGEPLGEWQAYPNEKAYLDDLEKEQHLWTIIRYFDFGHP